MFDQHSRACVVGGGPAGLAAAIALARQDCSVTVVDCAVPPIDKPCGEGLMPDSLAGLRELGIEVPEEIGFPFRGICFADRHSSVCAEFPNGFAKGLRRTALHEVLVRQATHMGVSMIWNAKHVRLAEGGISLAERFLPADLVVGADGQNSHIRRQARLERITHEDRRYGFRRHYRIAPWSPYMELHWGTNSQIYVTPIAADEICVSIISRDSRLRLERALDDFPELNERLRNSESVSHEMGALSLSRTLARVQRNNVVLVGDASGSVDAITGEGICLALKQAHALGIAIERGDLTIYQKLHKAIMKRPQAMASLILSLERNVRLQRRTLATLARHPEVFEQLLAVHVGVGSFRELCSLRLLGFGRAFLAA